MKTCRICKTQKDLQLFPKKGNACKDCVAQYMKAYRAAHAEHISNLKKAWKKANAEYVKERDRLYAIANPEKHQAARAKWRKANLYKVNALTRKRRATQLNRTPKWVDKDELWLINEVYKLATDRTKLHGFSWHVDHIVPLQGDNVSGLHTIANLQVIPGIENIRKGNKYA